MIRRIRGFHQDLEGDWIADLSCLHGQHVRHLPPFVDRRWVLSDTDRAARVGQAIECPLCDRAELPAGLVSIETMGPFDESTLPAVLKRAHRLPPSRWGLLRVVSGSCDIRIDTLPPITRELRVGDHQPIPPEVPHAVQLVGRVSLFLDSLEMAR